jgi:NAD(P)-dependent dehydrogenase (short-subunit alcohol dehydrogenase family)
MELITLGDWEWVIGVNLMGFVNGIEAFLPHIKAHGEGGHIVNSASIMGMISAPGIGPYNATKSALVALSETLAAELAGTQIGVSVLIPSFVRTRIAESSRNRATRFGPQRRDACRRQCAINYTHPRRNGPARGGAPRHHGGS